MFENVNKFLENIEAKSDGDMISKIIGVVFAVYVVAYALATALLTLINTTGFSSTGPIAPVLQTLLPIIIVIGVAWMMYKHMAVKG